MQYSLYPTDPIGQMLDRNAALAADIDVDAVAGWALIAYLDAKFGKPDPLPVDVADRIEAKVMEAVAATMPGAPDDFAQAVADVELHGIRYCKRGINWAAVEEDRIGD